MNNQFNKHNLDYEICKLDICKFKCLIPYKIYIQKSSVVNYKNKTFYPKIFLTKHDYYKMIREALQNIYNLMKSKKWEKAKKHLLHKKVTICIMHSGFIIFKVK